MRLSCLTVSFLFASACFGYVPKATLPACTRGTSKGVCGQSGTARAGVKYLRKFSDVVTLDACRIHCLQSQANDPYYDPICKSISYTPSTKSCILYEARPAGLGFKPKADSPTVFYNYPCFDCLLQCPQLSDQLLVNPDFDRPTTSNKSGNYDGRDPSATSLGPWNMDALYYNNTRLSLYPSGNGSPNSLRFYPEERIRQGFPSCIGQSYEISFDWKMESISTQIPHFDIFTQGDYERQNNPLYLEHIDRWWHFVDTTTIGAWSPTQQLTAPLPGYFTFAYYGDAYNNFFIDNIVIKPVDLSTYSSVPGSKSVLRNGGFEAGNLRDWRDKFSYNTKIVSPGYNSAHALGIGPGPSGGGTSAAAVQRFSLDFGTIYLLRFMYNTRGTCQGGGIIDLYLRGCPYATYQGNPREGYVHYGFELRPGNEWIAYQRPISPMCENPTLMIEIRGGDGCSPIVDDVTMKPMS